MDGAATAPIFEEKLAMGHVFVSYKSEDRDRVSRLVEALEQQGWKVWWDQDLLSGETYSTTIRERIHGSACTIVVWSQLSVESTFVWNEAREAKENGRPVLPVLLDDVTIPLEFTHLHTESLVGWTAEEDHPGLQSLIRAVQKFATPIAEAPAVAGRALLVGVSGSEEWPELPKLHSSVASVETLGRLLADPKTGCFRDVQPLLEPDQRKLSRALEDLFKNASENDLLLLYFNGPAVLDADSGILLCTRDTEAGYIESTSVSLSVRSRRVIDRSRSRRIVIILDCCYHSPADTGFSKKIKDVLAEEFGGGRGKYVITACSAPGDEVEPRKAGPSLFVQAFCHGIESAEADANGDEIITAEEIFRHAQKRLPSVEACSFDVSAQDLVLARSPQAVGPSKSLAPPDPDLMRVVLPLFARGVVIPFLGSGMYGSGPLSHYALSSALLDRAGLRTEEYHPVATAAECLERRYDDRTMFLDTFRDILEEQRKVQGPTAVHDLLLSLARPLLVVSATYGDQLERAFESAAISYTIVAHVLRSYESQHDGKIVVVRHRAEGVTVDLCLADELDLEEDQVVIYKVVGSPFLHDHLDPALGLDTVVATEFDHATFIFRLQDQRTSVPTAFSLPFRRNFLVFLGYTLDNWHYRLVAHLIGRAGKMTTLDQDRPRGSRRRFTVRQPTSPIEHLSWQRLGADLVQMDPGAFAQIILQAGKRGLDVD